VQDLAIGQLGQQRVHRLVQPQGAILHQDHRRHGRDRLGHRGDAEDRATPHRVTAANRLRADCIDVGFGAPADQRDDTGHVAALDVAGHNVVHAGEPRRGKSSYAHQLLPPSGLIRP
jgi:hypothetical protein